MTKVLFIVALREEFRELPNKFPGVLAYSGIGKINASYVTTQMINKVKPELIVNFGSVGRISDIEKGLHEIASVIERDFMAMPLSERGKVPFDDFPQEIYTGMQGVKCATGDSFVTSTEEWLTDQQVDVVDMELFAIAKVATKMDIPWRSFKFVTDDSNQDSADEWQKNLKMADFEFNRVLNEIIIY